MTRPTVRWASTWSGPFWASSSITKIAVSGQYLLWLTASTSRPRARSLLATQACGVGAPGVVPFGVVFAQAHHDEARQVAVLLVLAKFFEERFDVVGVAHFLARFFGQAVCRRHVADQARHAAFHAERAVRLADAAAVFAVAAIGQAVPLARVPDVAAGGVGQVAVVVVVDALALE